MTISMISEIGLMMRFKLLSNMTSKSNIQTKHLLLASKNLFNLVDKIIIILHLLIMKRQKYQQEGSLTLTTLLQSSKKFLKSNNHQILVISKTPLKGMTLLNRLYKDYILWIRSISVLWEIIQVLITYIKEIPVLLMNNHKHINMLSQQIRRPWLMRSQHLIWSTHTYLKMEIIPLDQKEEASSLT